MFKCPICGNANFIFLGIRNNEFYCRKCISFKGIEANVVKFNRKEKITPSLDYQLTKNQKDISNKVCRAIKEKKNVLIHAVCGAGKTEIVYDVIADAINNNQQVGFCIPRKDVVIELEGRIKQTFPSLNVVSVYGGNNEKLEGDIILLTTHQLFRYPKYFDLLIIDETDAFPFSGNDVLISMFDNSIKGNYIMMSATPLIWMKEKIFQENGVVLTLNKRYHGKKIVVPKQITIPFFQQLFVINKLNQYEKEKKPCFIFCPTIEEAELLYKELKLLYKDINCVHSKKENRNKIIDDFKKGKYLFLVTTSVLERGVTIKNLQVIVYDSSNSVYSKEMLIQIAGRVGRKKDAYNGDVYFLAKKPSVFISDAIKEIEDYNNYEVL